MRRDTNVTVQLGDGRTGTISWRLDQTNEQYFRSKLGKIKQLVDFLNENLNTYFYIAGGYLRDTLAGLPTKDIDIFTPDNEGEITEFFETREGTQLIYSSIYVNKYRTSNGKLFDISQNKMTQEKYLYNCDFINSCITYDSNHAISYHKDFIYLTDRRLLKINDSISIDNDSRMAAFRLGKFYERGYEYYTGNHNDFFEEIEKVKELSKVTLDIVTIK